MTMTSTSSSDDRVPPAYYCCIPIVDDNASLHTHGNTLHTDCCGGNVKNSNMILRSGPHRYHAIASRDTPAGTVIVQCLPMAYTIEERTDTEDLINNETLRTNFNGDGKPKRCARCFFKEGEMNGTRMGMPSSGGGGVCSKCRMVHYCCKSCQAQDWKEQHKLECQYFVERRKRSILGTDGDRVNAIPNILRTFSKLKFMKEQANRGKENAKKDAGEQHTSFQGRPIVSCSPAHFSSMMIHSPSFVMMDLELPLVSPAWMLAQELMASVAVPKDASSPRTSSEERTEAALAIWGYGAGRGTGNYFNTLDQAIRWTLNIMNKNSFVVKNVFSVPIGLASYPCAALLNHSCIPNCILRYKLGAPFHNRADRFHQPILQVIASRDVSAGEELCHSYVDLLLPPMERSKSLFEMRQFICDCTRCVAGERCTVKLPKDWQSKPEWPMKLGAALYGGYPDNGATSERLVDVRLDEVLTWCQGLSDEEQSHVHHQSQVLQQKAENSNSEQKAMRLLKQAVELYADNAQWRWSPYHSKVYEARNAYSLSIKMKPTGEDFNGIDGKSGTPDLLGQVMHTTGYMAVAFSQVGNHPELGMHLYKCGDLNLRMSQQNVSYDTGRMCTLMARALFLWAKKVLIITHGPEHDMVRNADYQIAVCNSYFRPVSK